MGNSGIAKNVGAVCIGLLAAAYMPAASPQLDARHREFLNGPTSLLITKSEREVFDKLDSAAARDRFIENFWQVRNPERAAGTNQYKEEFYKRLSFAGTFYSKDAGSEGWRTDRGRTYLLFGPPKSTQSFLHHQELVPMELWFYSNPGLRELPPFFYVLFYDQNGSGEYRFYHPYVHGPDKLVRSQQGKAEAYRYLRRINLELAQASLTSIPGEPVDTETYTGSIGSQAILNAAQSYREMRSYQAMIESRWNALERVQSRIEYKLSRAGLVTLAAYENGEPWLHWRLEMNGESGPPSAAEPLQYHVTARLFSKGKLVYERTDAPSLRVAADELPKLSFVAYENRMPLAPGTYTLRVAARWPDGQSFEASKEVTASSATQTAGLSEIVVSGTPEADRRIRPFQFGGVRFHPSADPAVLSSSGVGLLYQVMLPAERPQEFEVEYVIADSALRAKKRLTEKLSSAHADGHGAIVIGKTLPIEEFGPGTYQLSVRVRELKTGKIAARNARFSVVPEAAAARPVVIAPSSSENTGRTAANHYERALAWLSQGNLEQAASNLRASYRISKNPAVEALLMELNKRRPQSTKADGALNKEQE